MDVLGPRLGEGRVAAVGAVDQEEGTGPQAPEQDPPGPLLAGRVGTDQRADHRVGAALLEVDALEQGVGRRAARAMGPPERVLIGRRIRHGFDGPVEGQQAQAEEEGARGRGRRQGPADQREQLAQQPRAVAVARLADRPLAGRRGEGEAGAQAQSVEGLAHRVAQGPAREQAEHDQGYGHQLRRQLAPAFIGAAGALDGSGHRLGRDNFEERGHRRRGDRLGERGRLAYNGHGDAPPGPWHMLRVSHHEHAMPGDIPFNDEHPPVK